LEWSGIPSGTKSLALLCEDPDAPSGMWVHWVLYNIPPGIDKLPEHFLLKDKPVPEITGGTNDFRKLDYGGPCPPNGTHRYFFKIYALDQVLDKPEGINRKELLKAMEGHVVGQADVVGKYQRK
jgi:Raf kinase inhibitor-like YbhB/YbcL family protein